MNDLPAVKGESLRIWRFRIATFFVIAAGIAIVGGALWFSVLQAREQARIDATHRFVTEKAAQVAAEAKRKEAERRLRNARTFWGAESRLALEATMNGEWQEVLSRYTALNRTLDGVPEMQAEHRAALLGQAAAMAELDQTEPAFRVLESIHGVDWETLPDSMMPKFDALLHAMRERVRIQRERQAMEEQRRRAEQEARQEEEDQANRQRRASSARGKEPDDTDMRVAIEAYLRGHIADPDAEIVDLYNPVPEGEFWAVTASIRGKNGFGGPVIQRMTFLMKPESGSWGVNLYDVKFAR